MRVIVTTISLKVRGYHLELRDNDEELETIYNAMYDLTESTDPSNHKTYDELKSRLQMVLGERTALPVTTREQVSLETVREPAPMQAKRLPQYSRSSSTDDDEDTMSFFAKLGKRGSIAS